MSVGDLNVPSSRDSLKDYVRSIGGAASGGGRGGGGGRLFGFNSSWLSATASSSSLSMADKCGATSQPLLDDNQDESDAASAAAADNSGAGTFWTAFGDRGGSSSSCFQLNKRQRVVGFVLCVCGGAMCFSLAFVFLPFIMLKARKFAVLFTLGSILSLASFSMLWGPWRHLCHLMSRDRWPFTAAYIGTLAATLYSALSLHNTTATLVSACCQLAALVWFVASHLPGGQRGFQLMSSLTASLLKRTASHALPV